MITHLTLQLFSLYLFKLQASASSFASRRCSLSIVPLRLHLVALFRALSSTYGIRCFGLGEVVCFWCQLGVMRLSLVS